MLSIDDVVIYGIHGVCRVIEIAPREFAGNQGIYYTLKPVFDGRSTFFLPANGAAAESKLQTLLTKDQIDDLISTISQRDILVIENNKHRKDIYKEILESGNRSEIMCLIKTLYQRRAEQLKAGKRQHAIDERFMKEAETVLYEEFAYVLNIEREHVVDYIRDRIQSIEIEKQCMEPLGAN